MVLSERGMCVKQDIIDDNGKKHFRGLHTVYHLLSGYSKLNDPRYLRLIKLGMGKAALVKMEVLPAGVR